MQMSSQGATSSEQANNNPGLKGYNKFNTRHPDVY